MTGATSQPLTQQDRQVTYQFWQNEEGECFKAKIEAHVLPYIEALGIEGAVHFLMNFGGSCMYMGKSTHQKGMLERHLGNEQARALLERLELNGGYMRLPVANKFIARYLRGTGSSVSEIARYLHKTDVTIRRLLLPDHALHR